MTSWILEIWSSSLAPGKSGCRLGGIKAAIRAPTLPARQRDLQPHAATRPGLPPPLSPRRSPKAQSPPRTCTGGSPPTREETPQLLSPRGSCQQQFRLGQARLCVDK